LRHANILVTEMCMNILMPTQEGAKTEYYVEYYVRFFYFSASKITLLNNYFLQST